MDAGKISLEKLSSSQGERLSTGGNPSTNVNKTGRSPSPAFNLTQGGKSEAQSLLQVQQLSVPSASQPLSQFVKRSPSPAVGLFQSTSSGRSPSPSIAAAAYSSSSPASLAHGSQSSSSDGPPPPKKKRLFHRELKYMMHGFGDDPNPYSETVDLVEELVVQFITEMTVKAMEVGKSGRVHVNDIIFIIRKDPKKYSRVKDLLMMKEQIDKAKKAFSDDSEPLEI
jgi:transcription initiation factor TFIID subunit 13